MERLKSPSQKMLTLNLLNWLPHFIASQIKEPIENAVIINLLRQKISQRLV